MTKEPIVRIMIVDDLPIVIHGLRQVLETTPTFSVVAEAGNAEEARFHVKNREIDLVIMDIRLQSSTNGIELTKEFSAGIENPAILIFSDEKHVEFVRRALRAGARGYLLKGSDIGKIRSAVDIVMEGSIYLDGKLPRPTEQELDPLTLMEEKVLRLISEWKTTKQIAFELELAESTIKTHKRNIMSKLYLSGSHELEREAIRRYGNPDDRGGR
jgi:DNA-binding NarL/FixJ family response regulator